jgi:hypothetical protein
MEVKMNWYQSKQTCVIVIAIFLSFGATACSSKAEEWISVDEVNGNWKTTYYEYEQNEQTSRMLEGQCQAMNNCTVIAESCTAVIVEDVLREAVQPIPTNMNLTAVCDRNNHNNCNIDLRFNQISQNGVITNIHRDITGVCTPFNNELEVCQVRESYETFKRSARSENLCTVQINGFHLVGEPIEKIGSHDDRPIMCNGTPIEEIPENNYCSFFGHINLFVKDIGEYYEIPVQITDIATFDEYLEDEYEAGINNGYIVEHRSKGSEE